MLIQAPAPFKVADNIKSPLHRPEGETEFNRLTRMLSELPPRSVLPVSFKETPLFGASFADALVVTALLHIRDGRISDRYIVVCDMDLDAHRAVAESVKYHNERMDRQGSGVHLTCVYRHQGGTTELLGDAGELEKDTYAFARQHGTVTARSIADHFGISISAAANRLSRTAKLGVLVKDSSEILPGGGRQEVYAPIR